VTALDRTPPEVVLAQVKVDCPGCGAFAGQYCAGPVIPAWSAPQPCIERFHAATKVGLLPLGRAYEPNVLHRANGWTAVLAGGVARRRSLPGDTPELVRQLHALNDAGLLPPNCLDDSRPTGRCPRCGRLTAVADWYDASSLCTACRGEPLAQVSDVVGVNRAAYRRVCESLRPVAAAGVGYIGIPDTSVEPCPACGLPVVARVISPRRHVLLHVVGGDS
jgi:hypothetical protein